MKLNYVSLFSLLLLLMLSAAVHSQTKGLIYKPAGAGKAVLDPNLDGYTSQSPSGFVVDDEEESEIPYTPLPSMSTPEPDSDLGPGPDCGFTDLVKSDDNHSIYTYFDTNDNLLFRFRLGGTAENSKAYSILIDTDQKFGATGPNADPNYVQGNPGFEIEVVLETNFGVGLYDVDGTTNPTEIGDASTDRPYADFAQKSIAGSVICGDDDYFYDFYIPFSHITSAFGISSSTPLRMVGNTVINPHASIGNNGISDLGGIDDRIGITDDLWEDLIEIFPPTSPDAIATGATIPPRAECPSISGPIAIGATSITGTSSEVDGTVIEVFRDGISEGSTTVTSGNWTLSGITAAAGGEVFSATASVPLSAATAAGTIEKSESFSDCNETTVAETCSPAPTALATAVGTKEFTGNTTVTGNYEITVYDANGNKVTPSAGTSNPQSFTGSSWKFVYATTGNKIPGGTYYFTLKETGKCESSKVEFCTASATSTAPVISNLPVLANSSTLSGTATSGAAIKLYINSEEQATTTASGGLWSFSVANLPNKEINVGDVITVRSVESGSCGAEVSATVEDQPAPPIIQGSYCTSTGSISSVSGISAEAGATINIYTSATSPVTAGSAVATATVASNGSWTATVNIPAGNYIAASVTKTGSLESDLSNEVQVFNQTTASLAFTSTSITEGDASISGTGTDGNIIYLYLDGFIVDGFSTTVSGGTWTISGLDAATAGYDVLYAGAEIGVTAKNGSLCESSLKTGPTVDCKTPVSQTFSATSQTTICENETISFQIDATESLVIYELIDQAGNGVGPARLGNDDSSAISLTTFSLSQSDGVTGIQVKAQRIGISCETILTPAIAVEVKPIPEVSLSNTDLQVCGSDNSVDLAYTVTANGPAYDYSIDFDASAETAGFVDITDNTSINSPISVSIPSGVSAGAYNAVFTVRNSDFVQCTSEEIAFTITVTAPDITGITPTNPSSCGTATGSLELVGLEASSSYDGLTYYKNGSLINHGSFTSDTSGNYVISALGAGSYSDFEIVFNGCTSSTFSGPVVLTDPGAAVIGEGSHANVTNCTSPNGEIVLTGVTSGDYTVRYTYGGSQVSQILTATSGGISIPNLTSGNYTNLYIEDATNCRSNVIVGPVTLVNSGIPAITLGSNPNVSQGSTSADLTFSATTNNPDRYSIDFDAAAETEGFSDVNNISFSASPIVITVPSGATSGTYNANLTVQNSITGCVSNTYPITISIYTPAPVNFTIDQINDVNLNENSGYTSVTPSISGDTPVGSLTYTLGGADASLFTINSSTGEVSMLAKDFENPVDANTDNIYELSITATDEDGNSDSETWTVNIIDTNDESPVLSASNVSVAEGTTSVLTASATDADAGDSQTFSINGTDSGLFTINSSSGDLVFNSAPDFESPADNNGDNVYELTITVTDGNGNTDAKDILVTVTDTNDESPVLSANNISVAEGTTSVLTASATDADAGDTQTYSISGTDVSLFTIDPSSGILVFNSVPDFESPADNNVDNVYELTVTVTDGNGNTDAKAILVTVTDSNDESPVLSANNVSVAEGTTSVLTASATDADAGDTQTYSISGTDSGLFTINSSSGVLVFNSAPDFESPADNNADNVYELTITVTDGNGNTDAKDILVTVTDTNDESPVLSASNVSVAEGNTAVLTASATDSDAGDTQTFSISGTDSGLFTINSSSGVLVFNSAPDFEGPADNNADNVYELTITVTDGNGNTDAKAILVTVTDSNDESPVLSVSNVSVAEGTTPVLTASATDADAGDSQTFSISGTDSGLFTINSSTGVLVFNSAPDFESPADNNADNVYELTITVTDSNGNTDAQTIFVTVTDSNDESPVLSASNVSVSEGTTAVLTASATDADEGDTQTFSISGTDSGLFTINSSSGVLVFNSAPDFESPADNNGDNVYELTITVTDGNGNTDAKDILVTVTDSNDESPVLSASNVSVAEGSTAVLTASATDADADAGDTQTYSISGTDASLFTIDPSSGILVFNSAPDFESPADNNGDNVYELTITVTDSNGNTDAKTILVTVTDSNDESPVLSANNVSVAEGTTAVLTASATDADAGDSQTYSISGTDSGLFTINSSSGVLVFNSAPDFESPADNNVDNVYELTVTVTDGNGNTDAKAILVTVTDSNDESPVLSANNVSVAEGTTSVLTASATDADAGDTQTYSISGTDSGLFTINSSSGVLVFNSAPDFESPADNNADNVYELTITVTDGNGNTDAKDILVTVTDTNDESPVLSASNVSVAEGTTSVLTASATDADAGDSQTYSISGTDSGLFTINSSSGVLVFNSAPDFESPADNNADNVYELTITVTDSNGNTDAKTILVTVTDVQTWYEDADNDGFGNAGSSITSSSQPAGYVADNTDCDDSDNTVHSTSTYYVDADGDGYGSTPQILCAATAPPGYASVNGDCVDSDNTIYPGAPEICDGKDNNCEGTIDEGVTTTYYADTDNDGFGDPSDSVEACAAPANYVSNNTDCNDSDADEFPGQTWYLDADGDGYSEGTSQVACTRPADHFTATELTSTSGDCDDSNATINPGATEIPDNDVDENCDGVKTYTFYADTDNDGFGDPSDSQVAETAPLGYVSDNTDCNDSDADEFPGQTWYLDADGDGYSEGTSQVACTRPADHFIATELTSTSGDCDDSNATINPGAVEVCDGIDNNCDGTIDEGVISTFYKDNDGDGYGDPSDSIQACSAPSGYVADNTDCDDSEALAYPGNTEILYDGIDNDCDPSTPDTVDADGDGVNSDTDCDDNEAAAYPGNTEILYDGIDNDCDPSTPDTIDADGDGVNSDTDCDDSDPDEFPGQTWYLAVDNDNDGFFGSTTSITACEKPGAEYSLTAPATPDCDDSDPDEFPGQTWYVGVDNDNDGFFGSTTSTIACEKPGAEYTLIAPTTPDCNDADNSINPDTVWYLGVDNDNDGFVGSVTSVTQCSSPGTGYSTTAPAVNDCDDSDGSINPDTVWYIGIDGDSDGFFGRVNSVTQCNSPGAGYSTTAPAVTDCDDADNSINPDTVWYIGVDGDSDGFFGSLNSATQCSSPGTGYSTTAPPVTDCDDADNSINPNTVWYIGVDSDSDEFFGSVNSITQCSSPGAGYSTTAPAVTDCDDSDGAINPDTVWYIGVDGDSDGFIGSVNSVTQCSSPGAGYSTTAPAVTDCNDSDNTINPYTLWYIGVDGDSDGFFGSVNSVTQCSSPGAGYSTTAPAVTDCNDSDDSINPDTVWYIGVDNDSDGFFGSVTSVTQCSSPGTGYSTTAPAVTDCNDSDDSINPDTVWYIGVDNDSDGYFGSVTSVTQCSSPGTGYSTTAPAVTDCDDSDNTINPDTVWYIGVDGDSDGFFGSVNSVTQCSSPGTGYSTTAPEVTDCDDSDGSINPDTVWYIGVDNDSDGFFGSVNSITQCSAPGTGYSTTAPPVTDCDDSDGSINPDTVWYIGVDNDSDGFMGSVTSVTQCSSPGTGYSTTAPAVNDCDDSDGSINPDTVWYIGIDGDSDGFFGRVNSVTQCNSPGAGYSTTAPAVTDCDDADNSINPDTVWYIGVDGDSDGFFGSVNSATQCSSPGTGYSTTAPAVTDCNDSDNSIHPNTVWYIGVDGDSDGFFGSVTSVTQCSSPGTGYSTTAPAVMDCNDSDDSINPDTVWYIGVDDDSDGFFGSVNSVTQCSSPGAGYSTTAPPVTDCNDSDNTINPDTVWYIGVDGDSDGFFGSMNSVTQCSSPGTDYSTTAPAVTDCNDSDNSINPDTVWYIGVDGDSDGFFGSVNFVTQCSSPGTGFSTTSPAVTDCDDADNSINPNTVWYIGVDSDSDGFFGSVTSVTQCSSPGTGYSTTAPAVTDCDDADNSINPDTVWYIGVDDDGDGFFGSVTSVTQCNSPGAGYSATAPAVTDCNDSDNSINPDTVWYIGVDDDSDGFFGSVTSVTQCNSPGAGYSTTAPAVTDCDDADNSINPDTVWYIGVDGDSDGFFGSVTSVTQCSSPGTGYSTTAPVVTDCNDSDGTINPDTVWYFGVDNDSDGFFGSVTSVTQCSFPGAGYSTTAPAVTDCDDSDPDEFPGQTWYVGVDNDNDGFFGSTTSTIACEKPGAEYALIQQPTPDCDDTDNTINPSTIWYIGVDNDNDGFFGSVTSVTQCSSPGTGYSTTSPPVTDCDDADNSINPNTVWYIGVDNDSDGFFGSVNSVTQCNSPGVGYSTTAPAVTDCDDADNSINPDTVWYIGVDDDSDGFLGSVTSVTQCSSPGAGYSTTAPAVTDCDDSDGAINPDTVWYIGVDNDSDGFFGSVNSITQCSAPGTGYSTTAPPVTDCDDSDGSINPDTVWYIGVDGDSDGFFGSVTSVTQCSSPGAGYSTTAPAVTDCDDSDNLINPDTVWYFGIDGDNDGFFGSVNSVTQCSSPGAGYSTTAPAVNDCDDSDEAINPDSVWYIGVDGDNDGFFGSVNSVTQCSSPGTGYSITAPTVTDCNDSDNTINPDTVWYLGVDGDSDGFFGSVTSVAQCSSPGAGYSTTAPAVTDCDDADNSINPDTVWYIGVDDDSDGFFGSVNSVTQCSSPGPGYSTTSPVVTDCDDSDNTINPDTVWYMGVDGDSDGFFGGVTSVTQCSSPGTDYSSTAPTVTDCDDSDNSINPNTVWYIGVDGDSDGFFGSVNSVTQCSSPGAGYSTTAPAVTDCNDSDDSINPDTVWYIGVDNDSDGFFGSVNSVTQCNYPGAGYSTTAPAVTDCDDADNSINPNTMWYIGVDSDSDGFFGSVNSVTQCSSPGAGYSTTAPAVTDCDDADNSINPDTVWYIGVDNDSDGFFGSVNSVTQCSSPGIDYSTTAPAVTDCDDSDPNEFPGQTWYAGVDNDNDGFFGSTTSITACEKPGTDYALIPQATPDCDDSNAMVNPAAAEIPGNETDENCDGIIEADSEAIYTVVAARSANQYLNSDLLASATDSDGNIISAQVSEGGLPAGLSIDADGSIRVNDHTLLVPGSYEITVITTDIYGNTTIQVVQFEILPNPDNDNDGLTNEEEILLGTDPNRADSDGDGLTDGEEVLGIDDPSTELIPTGVSDPFNECDPHQNGDTCDPDEDGLSNAEERSLGTDPENPDTDGDGLTDGEETSGMDDPATELKPNGVSDPLNECDPNQVSSRCFPNGLTVNQKISPNGDGINDHLEIKGIEHFPDNRLEIYNRWGVLVFDTNGYGQNDNFFKGISQGRYTINKGEDLPEGTYFYVLKYKFNDQYKDISGYIYLNR